MGSRITPRLSARGEGEMSKLSMFSEMDPLLLRVDLVPRGGALFCHC